tara:strand:+ start:2291 stop:2932 length:642 start_codon:yes stop_codon:yes gene_type:complete
MDLKTRLSSHPVSTLKKEISKTNVKGYSKMKKEEVVALMMKSPERFNHIQAAVVKEKKAPAPRKEKVAPVAPDKKKVKIIKKASAAPEPPAEPAKKNKYGTLKEADGGIINPNARKIQKEALKLLEDNKTFFEKIPVSKGYGDRKTIDINTNYYKEQKHNLINRTLAGSDKDATRTATFYLNKLTDRLKNKTAAEPAAAGSARRVKKIIKPTK